MNGLTKVFSCVLAIKQMENSRITKKVCDEECLGNRLDSRVYTTRKVVVCEDEEECLGPNPKDEFLNLSRCHTYMYPSLKSRG